MIDMFPMIFNRLQKADQLMPKYVGKFCGVSDLPRGSYPPIYWWEDVSIGKLRLSFNKPLLEDMCTQVAADAGIVVSRDDAAVDDALAKLRDISARAFEVMIRSLDTAP